MGLRFSVWNLLLSLLFLCAQVLSENLHDSHSIPSHMNHMDPSTMVFFTLKDLKIGETMPIYFRKRDPSAYPQALPREEADSIPFSLKQLPYLLQFFSFPDDSPLAKAMEGTLNHCEVPPIEGETKICATSLESMLDFVHRTFGLETKFQVPSTKFLTKSATIFQNYTILQVPKPMVAPKMVACHIMPYPYAIFYCHSQMTENKLFGVSLGGDNGDRVEAVAVATWIRLIGVEIMHSFVFLGSSQGAPMSAISSRLIILYTFQHLPTMIKNVLVM